MPLNKPWVFKIAQDRTPEVAANILPDSFRHDVIRHLEGKNNIGIELGVATGIFSKRMMDSGKFKKFFGVDIYGDIHDTNEYKNTLANIGLMENYNLLRMAFEDAIELFEDNSFDFIYVDGFAHTGEEGGQTLFDWYKKLKPGGIIAGDDYDNDWPLVKWAVNDFAIKAGSKLWMTEKIENTAYSMYPSWFIEKVDAGGLADKPDQELISIAKKERDRIDARRRKKLAPWRVALRKWFKSSDLKRNLRKVFPKK
jgi:ubiquinone/menaquinone biosynthesis C-methylase UbiE